MSDVWDGCTKIHENCGGLVKWVEAIDTPGVGYFGQCERCQEEQIVVERIIPIETGQSELGKLLNQGDYESVESLRWEDDESWDKNQQRLKQELEEAL